MRDVTRPRGLPERESYQPGLHLRDFARVDTLFLSPLAYPETVEQEIVRKRGAKHDARTETNGVAQAERTITIRKARKAR